MDSPSCTTSPWNPHLYISLIILPLQSPGEGERRCKCPADSWGISQGGHMPPTLPVYRNILHLYLPGAPTWRLPVPRQCTCTMRGTLPRALRWCNEWLCGQKCACVANYSHARAPWTQIKVPLSDWPNRGTKPMYTTIGLRRQGGSLVRQCQGCNCWLQSEGHSRGSIPTHKFPWGNGESCQNKTEKEKILLVFLQVYRNLNRPLRLTRNKKEQ